MAPTPLLRHRPTAWTCLILTLALFALAWLASVGEARRATFVVNTTEDENTLCNAASCSLREAIEAAAPGDEITFSSLFDSTRTITLQHGELLIEKNLTITAPESLVAVSGNNQSRILRVRTGFTVSISNMVFFNGNGVGGSVTGVGGAILTQGNLTLTRCLLVGNTSSRGGAIFNAAGGNLTLVESQIDSNTSTDRGGGISSNTTLNVLRSTIIGNIAQGSLTGGGIDASGTLNVINSTISNNRVTNSTGPNAGGIFVSGANSTATIVNTTVTQNFVASNFHTGGIHRDGGTVMLRNTIVAGNQTPPLPAQADAGKSGVEFASAPAEQAGENAPDVGGQLVSAPNGGNNLVGDAGPALGLINGVNGDQVGGDGNPKLDAKLDPSPKNNGGPTKTHALKEDSPARDAGNNCVVDNTCKTPLSQSLLIDQRGLSRLVGGGVDIGSFELGAAPTLPTLSITDVTGPEASVNVPQNTFPFEVKLSPPSDQTVTVTASTAPNTALAGSDFVQKEETLTFAPGETVKTFNVSIVNDDVAEGEEVFGVVLSNPTDATIGDGVGIGTIRDDDQPSISVSDELHDEVLGRDTKFSVRLSRSSTVPITVQFATADNTAKAGEDYFAVSGTRTFAPGETLKEIFVTPLDDDEDEVDETYFVNLSNPTNATLGVASQGVGTLRDDDGPDITAQNARVNEGNSGSANVNVPVTLSQDSPQDITFNFQTADGTATAGSDYTASSGQVTIPAGQTTANIPLSVLGDTLSESDETFTIRFLNSVNGKLPQTEFEVRIVNDDSPDASTLQFGNGSLNVSEGASTSDALKSLVSDLSVPPAAGANSLAVTVTRTGNLNEPATVDYETRPDTSFAGCEVSNGAASERCDFTTTLGTLRFAPGEASKTFNVFITDDAYREGTETFTVALTNPTGTGVALGGTNTLTVTVTDDDTGAVPNPVDATEFFVRQHYLDFLNREPDEEGLRFWTDGITSCGSDAQCVEVKRIHTSAAFFLSIEFEGTGYQVIRIYKTTFKDSPQRPRGLPRYREFMRDAQTVGRDVAVGVGDWEQRLAANLLDFAREWVQRPEVLTELPADMTAAQFVDKLFANAETTPAASERDNAIAAFGAGGVEGRAAALLAVTASGSVYNQQFNSALVLMEYFGYLRRNPFDAPDADFVGFDFWLNKLNSFSLPGEDMRDAGAALSRIHRAEMVRAFISSIEYRARFGQN
jgi:CSLREA domain-containing protein